jgi:hypothetical protein
VVPSLVGDCPCVGRKPSRDPALAARGLFFGMVKMVLWRVCAVSSGAIRAVGADMRAMLSGFRHLRS